MELKINNNPGFSAEDAVAFLRLQGRRVVKTKSCWWYNAYGQKNVYYSFPPNRLVTPNEDELKAIFKLAPNAKAVRYLSAMTGYGRDSYIWACRKPFNLQTIHGKARNQVRQGLRKCTVRHLRLDELEVLGGQASSDSTKRFGIGPEDLKFSKEMCESPAYEAWGAFFEGNLAAYLVTFRVEDWVYIQIHRSVDKYLKHRPNNALIFRVLHDLLSRPEISTVSYGWEPLYDLDSLDVFKLRMGSAKEPCKQSFVLTPWLRIAFPQIVCRAIEKLSNLDKNSHRLRQIAGVCRVIRESSR
jgi:hypothetical protein